MIFFFAKQFNFSLSLSILHKSLCWLKPPNFNTYTQTRLKMIRMKKFQLYLETFNYHFLELFSNLYFLLEK